MKTIKLKSLKDCESLISKNVKFKYHNKFKTGVVKSFEVENRTVFFKIKDANNFLTVVSMHDLIEETNEIIKTDLSNIKFKSVII